MLRQDIKALSEAHMHRYVEVRDQNGICFDGIVEYIDEETLCLAVPGAVEDRAFGPGGGPGFGPGAGPGFGPGFGPGPGPGFGPGPLPFRPRRFTRLALPLYALTALTLLPYY
ncbi:hypothetical protein [Cohnella hashimotonis]|uniref:Uncharacterized protein n=1 Tax=Cohnella hashimotonis TaxID=2826895 RepID=A0ABT6TL26_9BACL|nr:hypothetical protein [Cohnella hashimotonis]MDI4646629.1 hypothetical protein [Cohnella hashimotonis]